MMLVAWKNFVTLLGHVALKSAARICSQYSNVDFSSSNERRSTISSRSLVMLEDSFAVTHAGFDSSNSLVTSGADLSLFFRSKSAQIFTNPYESPHGSLVE